METSCAYKKPIANRSTRNRLKTHAMIQAVERSHAKHGSAIFLKTETNIESISVTNANNAKVLEVELKRAAVT